MNWELLGLLSGALQALGYLLYVRGTIAQTIQPNPTSWIMFAWGTALVTLLEWDSAASIATLVLPITCTACSVLVAALVWRSGNLQLPTETTDIIALVTDALLSTLYAGTWLLLTLGYVTPSSKNATVAGLLIVATFSTIVAFIPLLRTVYVDSNTEKSPPWIVWTLAYGALFLVTLVHDGATIELLAYPTVNFTIHGFVALLTLRNLWH